MQNKQHIKIITGALLLSNIMAGMDSTIVNTALPAITSDLHGLQYMGWIVATFLLGMATSTPIWSKIGEHKGNKLAYIFATSLFAIGAFFQGLAPNIVWFIIARSVMGIGAGGMNTIPFIIYAELYDNLKTRAQILGFASAAYSTASIAGPLLGGWIVDSFSWHWVFYVNLPLAIIAIILVSSFYKKPVKQSAGKPIDYLGATLLVSGLIVLLVGVQLIGSANPLLITALFIISIILIAWMVKVDNKAADPIVPSRLFKNAELVKDFILFVTIWGSFIAFVTYMPMWAQGLLGLSALLGGMTQTPGAITSFIASQIVPPLRDKLGKYQLITIGAASIGVSFLWLVIGGIRLPFSILLVIGALEGFGVGIAFSVLQINVQSDAEMRDVPIATSMGFLLRILSQTIMSAIYGVILNNALFAGVKQSNGKITLRMLNWLSNARTANRLPAKLIPQMRIILFNGYRMIFIVALLLLVISLLIVIPLAIRERIPNKD